MPMPPGADLGWVADGDNACASTPGCPDERYLADRFVFTTEAPELSLDMLPSTSRASRSDHHEITIVLLDGTGRRIGESAWYVEVRVEDRS
jgi:hypothetical protein